MRFLKHAAVSALLLTSCAAPTTPSKSVVLPRSIDPSGRAEQLPTGTKVFVNRSTVIRYRTVVNGKAFDQETLINGFASLSHENGSTTVLTKEGARLIFPANARVARDQAAQLIFVRPSETMPPMLAGRTPDYVVP
ncbi:MAG TPA: hypothetical protein VF741_00690 [Candidatus Aquilonibacter sp.]